MADTVDLRCITDWTLLTGASIEIRQQGSPICSEKAEFYEVWAKEDRPGFHYEVTKGFGLGNA